MKQNLNIEFKLFRLKSNYSICNRIYNLITKKYLLLYFSVLLLLFSSCAINKDSSINQLVLSSKCNEHNIYSYINQDFPKSLEQITVDSILREKISYKSLHIANIIGIIPYLNEYANLKITIKSKNTVTNQLRLLELRQIIHHHINNATLGISAVSSELDCEEERISQIANYLSEKQGNLESKLTIGAIAFGATGAILTAGVIKNQRASNAVGITTGVGEAALGLTMLFNKRKIKLQHERNILRDIWEGPATSTLLPSFIWYYLNHQDLNNNSLRKEIIEKWIQFGQIDINPGKKAVPYFGDSGIYTADQLDNRADMYDQLDSQIFLLNQKLMILTSEIDNI